VCGLLILASHVASAFLRRNLARYATLSGVALHVPLAILLFFAGVELDFFVAAMLLSVLIYSLLNYVSSLKEKKEGSDR
jgi:hypothetical protein